MARPDTVLRSIKTALQESDRLPDPVSYSTFELDQDGGQSNVRPPVVEITVINSVRSQPHNTDFVDYATDGSGNHIGRIYHALFEMDVQIDVWTAEGGQYNPHDIGEDVRRSLYRHDTHQYGETLPDPETPSSALESVDYFTVDDGSVENDLTMTPALRRWRQTAEVWFHEEINTATEYGAEDYVVNVVSPSDGSFEAGTDVAIVFDATSSEESTADQHT